MAPIEAMEEASQPGEEQAGLRQRAPLQASDAPENPAKAAGLPPRPTGPHGRARKRTCCRRFLSSGIYKVLMLSMFSVVPGFGLVFAMPRMLAMIGWTGHLCLAWHYALAVWISFQFAWNFGMTQWTDPGGSRLVKPSHETTGQFEMGPAEGGQEECQALLFAPNWCEMCQHWKPPRSHHCSVCQRCVLRMDHHCPITGTCIGMRNHGHFFLMYIFAVVGLCYSLGLCLLTIFFTYGTGATPGLHDEVQKLPMGLVGAVLKILYTVLLTCGLETTLQLVLTLVAWVMVLSCGIPAMHMACSGSTTLECAFPMKEYVQIQPQVYCPLGPGFYNRGAKQNLRDILGPRWRLRLLMPTRGGKINLEPAVRPRPSPAGAEALEARLKQVREEGVARQVSSCKELGLNPGPSGELEQGSV